MTESGEHVSVDAQPKPTPVDEQIGGGGPTIRIMKTLDESEQIAPAVSSGAVSPNARASERIVPVRIPGAAYGTTWLRTVSQRVAPTPKAASRMLFGTARSASDVVITAIGRTSTASVSPPAISDLPRPSVLTNIASPSRP